MYCTTPTVVSLVLTKVYSTQSQIVVGLGVTDGVGVFVAVAVFVGVMVGVTDGVGVFVGVSVGVIVGVGVGVSVGVSVGVGVGVGDGHGDIAVQTLQSPPEFIITTPDALYRGPVAV